MAQTDYGPEIRSSMAKQTDKILSGRKAGTVDTVADMARDRKAGIPEGSARDAKLDAKPGNSVAKSTPTPPKPKNAQAAQDPSEGMPMHMQSATGMPPNPSGIPSDLHRVSHAAGIAHAILGGRRMM